MIEARIVKFFECEDIKELMEQFTEWVREIHWDDLEFKGVDGYL